MSGDALLLAAPGSDSSAPEAWLHEAGATSLVCHSTGELERALRDDTSCVLLTEDAVQDADLAGFSSWVSAQQPWSDLPIMLLVKGGAPYAGPLAGLLRNLVLLDPGCHTEVAVSIVRAALRSRRRQHKARALTEEIFQSDLARAAELQSAHRRVMEQMAERHRVEERLRQVQVIETIGQLTGGVAHDFNNLLMAVLGNLQLLRKRLPDDPRLTRLLDGAFQGARRGAMLTQRLMAFARQQDLLPVPVDVVALIHGMRGLLEQSVGPGIELRADLPAGLPPAMADASQIETALLNLVANARDAMPDGGIIRIELAHSLQPAAPDLQPGAYLSLALHDTGTGMDAETLKRAVEPFFSTKELGKGTGLGLSVIHGLALQLNGALRLSSVPGTGTRAELWLPVAGGSGEHGGLRSAPAASILLVDDDALVGMSTARMLEDLGHRVTQALSGADALAVLRSDALIDLLITDYAMPRMTGLELARAARAVRPGLLVLLATGYLELPSHAERELPRLSKPYTQEQLATQIDILLDADQRKSPAAKQTTGGSGL